MAKSSVMNALKESGTKETQNLERDRERKKSERKKLNERDRGSCVFICPQIM